MQALSGLLGIPPPNGVIPQAPMHTKSLITLKQMLVERDGKLSSAAASEAGKNVSKNSSAVDLVAVPSKTKSQLDLQALAASTTAAAAAGVAAGDRAGAPGVPGTRGANGAAARGGLVVQAADGSTGSAFTEVEDNHGHENVRTDQELRF